MQAGRAIRSQSLVVQFARLIALSLSALVWPALATAVHAQAAGATPRITLGEALASAAAHAPEIAAAESARAVREAEVDSAEAAWFPTLSAQGSGGYSFDNRLVLPGAPRIDSRSLTAESSVALEWTAIDFARANRIDAARASANAQDLLASATQENVLLLASERYVHAAAASALVKDAELALARRQEQEQAIDALVRAGTRSPLDLARAKIETLDARYTLEGARRDELSTCAALASAIGRSPTAPVCARSDAAGGSSAPSS
jgi:outer membrane protein